MTGNGSRTIRCDRLTGKTYFSRSRFDVGIKYFHRIHNFKKNIIIMVKFFIKNFIILIIIKVINNHDSEIRDIICYAF